MLRIRINHITTCHSSILRCTYVLFVIHRDLLAESVWNYFPCSGSPPMEPHQVTLDAQQRDASSQLCLHDLQVTPERAGMIINVISNLEI